MEKAFLTRLKQQLKEPLPGMDAQFEMAHVNRQKLKLEDLDPVKFRDSAVMVLLVERGNTIYIPLTERHTYNGAHSGQISVPGGKFDPADETFENTALRECYEEIGIKKNIEVLGA